MNHILQVTKFSTEEGDSWWSVIALNSGEWDLATGVIHDSKESALAEMESLNYQEY